jgi:hypothetical protein
MGRTPLALEISTRMKRFNLNFRTEQRCISMFKRQLLPFGNILPLNTQYFSITLQGALWRAGIGVEAAEANCMRTASAHRPARGRQLPGTGCV